MATALVARSNRFTNTSTLAGALASVALDATINNDFNLPSGYGDLLLQGGMVWLDTLSGAYVAPAPAYDGFLLTIQSQSQIVDAINASRFVNVGTQTARPVLATSFDLNCRLIIRQDEYFTVRAPILAGAGVTGSLFLILRGIRLRQV